MEILGGLKAGERIVTSGNFLIDSESQLKRVGGREMIDRIIEFSARNRLPGVAVGGGGGGWRAGGP